MGGKGSVKRMCAPRHVQRRDTQNPSPDIRGETLHMRPPKTRFDPNFSWDFL